MRDSQIKFNRTPEICTRSSSFSILFFGQGWAAIWGTESSFWKASLTFPIYNTDVGHQILLPIVVLCPLTYLYINVLTTILGFSQSVLRFLKDSFSYTLLYYTSV